ncbi:GNAT family N-acetyltransferase [Fimbriimonas ginsengisoli]|uniref:GCN5-like N-acetyltransferase n=1 Tax=Fimbriimonas ginsengisoli Gsoil 348 TaxID=661478 RepID=A0A068NYP3_FIMGI|nr:GNAT family N-acetyltransferase [Fimbriimonas ginsengisoli]AIE87174.1 GCN5-like N-acetyltransferase [Fimbriimonas ginsengisoli Gsoil 348]
MSQLVMRRDRLDVLPGEPPLAGNYLLREAVEADASGLASVLTAAFGDEWTEADVFERLLRAPDVRRTFVIVSDQGVVATASSQTIPDRWPDSGVVHWVGAEPAHAGRGLGYAVCLAVLRDHRDAGLTSAVLTTDDERLAAIRTYLKLGFRPLECDSDHGARWAAVFGKLAQTETAK